MSAGPLRTLSAFSMGVAVILSGMTIAMPASAEAQGSAQPDTSRRVCRNITPSGSRLTRRVCRTQAEWDQSRDQNQEGVLQHQINEGSSYEQQAGPR